jgi:hypothetical protein
MKAMRIVLWSLMIVMWGSGVIGAQQRNPSEIFLGRLQHIVHELKQASALDDQVELSKTLWELFDEQLPVFLDQHLQLTLKDLNKGLETLLQSESDVDDIHSKCAIELYQTGDPNLLISRYDDLIWFGNGISTIRVIQRTNNHWHMAGRMEDATLYQKTYPEHQKNLRQEQSRQFAKAGKVGMDKPPTEHEQYVGALASRPLSAMAILFEPSSIHLLPQGGVGFIAIHIAGASITVDSPVQWEWKPSKGLEAVAWIWGDQWTYDEQERSEVAEWQTADKAKKGLRVKLQDLLRTQ